MNTENFTITREEAKNIITDHIYYYRPLGNELEAYRMAKQALEMQIPKKPNNTYKRLGITVEGCCPTCGAPVAFGYRCSNNDCGQAIDWSEDNE